MYSLVSSAVLVTDLLRQPRAAELMEVLSAALRLSADELRALTAADTGRDRRALREARARAAAMAAHRPGMAAAVAQAGRAQVARAEERQTATTLAGASFADLAAVHRLLATDVFGWVPTGDASLMAGVQVVCDAVTAAWVHLDLPESDVDLLAGPWRSFADGGSPAAALDLGPEPAALGALLQRLPGTDEDVLTELERSWALTRGTWAGDVHAACWAAYTADRLRMVAAVQLAAGQALLGSAVDGRVLAVRAGLTVPAAVQVLCLADLLDDELVDRRTAAVVAAYGPLR